MKKWEKAYPTPDWLIKKDERSCWEALGFDYSAWEPEGSLDRLNVGRLHPATKKVLDEFISFVNHPNFLVGVAAIAASESVVSQQYANLVSLLRQTWPEITDDDMRHLLDHIEHDVHHGKDLEILLAQEQDQETVQYGNTHAERVWKEFWDQV